MNCFKKSDYFISWVFVRGKGPNAYPDLFTFSFFGSDGLATRRFRPYLGMGGRASTTVKIVGSWSPEDTTSVVVDEKWTVEGKNLKTTRYGGPYTLRVFFEKIVTMRSY